MTTFWRLLYKKKNYYFTYFLVLHETAAAHVAREKGERERRVPTANWSSGVGQGRLIRHAPVASDVVWLHCITVVVVRTSLRLCVLTRCFTSHCSLNTTAGVPAYCKRALFCAPPWRNWFYRVVWKNKPRFCGSFVKYGRWSIRNESECVRLKYFLQFIYQFKIHFYEHIWVCCGCDVIVIYDVTAN